MGPVSEYPVIILESHLDTFGHVNNAVYLQLFEQARWEIITSGGYGLDYVQKTQVGPTILDIHVQFRRELKLRDRIIIRSQITSVAKKTMTMRQTMVNANGEEACICDFVIGLFDLKTRRLIEPTPEWRRALGLPPA